ncbi:MAG: exo-alpha-sialidase [Victivallales bacterium]|nr:exo-alpha-sialidase [Victivallales bacterium]
MQIIKHITVCSRPYERFGYFAWPSIAKQADGTLVVAASGLRFAHCCPWGRSVIIKSSDNGETWTEPVVVNNTPLDDRDAGIVSLGGQRLALTWFNSDSLRIWQKFKDAYTGKWDEDHADGGAILEAMDDDTVRQNLGSFLRVSLDGEYWGPVKRVPVTTPHGFIVLKDSSWLYLGKLWRVPTAEEKTCRGEGLPVVAYRSTDEGNSWIQLGSVPGTATPECGGDFIEQSGRLLNHVKFPDTVKPDYDGIYFEPHVVELDNGELLGAVRYQYPYKTCLTRSTDGGRTWSPLVDCGINGVPPHFLRHSSGAIICAFGYRSEPRGQRAKVSTDNGYTWGDDIILRDDGPSPDLGYPASVELDDGSILTIYYQLFKPDQKCSIMGTRWRL